MKDSRQPYSATMPITIGGVTAPPSRAALCVTPCAMPRSLAGSQNVKARVAVGKAPPSPMPRMKRNTSSEAMPQAKPHRIVAIAQMMLSTASTRRGPNLSAHQPPMICIAAYGYAKAEKISPSSVGDRPNSLRMNGPATAMLTRSM